MKIKIVNNTPDLHGFDSDMAIRFGVTCAVVYNGLACEANNCAEVINAGMGKNLNNRVVVEDGILWVRYETTELFGQMFTYLEPNTIQKALKKLERHKLIQVRPDKGTGFTWVTVSFELE